jgi:hypothetical protein
MQIFCNAYYRGFSGQTGSEIDATIVMTQRLSNVGRVDQLQICRIKGLAV